MITGTIGNDILIGNSGNNVIKGLDGDDILNGRKGQDTLRGGNGDDTLRGQNGNDRLYGGSGNDELFGGDGDDWLNPGSNISFDNIWAGNGNDTVVLSDISTGYAAVMHDDLSESVIINIDGSANTASVNKGTNGTTVITDVTEPLFATTSFGGLGISGTDFDDIFNISLGSGGWMLAIGGAGNDTFNIGIGTGRIRLDYRDAENGVSIDLTQGMAFDDGHGDIDTIIGQGRVWEVATERFNDTVIGSANDESFILYAGTDTVDGRGGIDRLRYDKTGVEGLVLDLSTGTGTGIWNGDGFNHTISNIESVFGSRTDDILRGDSEDNYLWGNLGDDELFGGSGRDELVGAEGKDNLWGGNGSDTMWGGNGSDTLKGEQGNDDLIGQNGNDKMFGGGGRDRLWGEVGNDKLRGGAGNDEIQGQDGNDKLFGGADDDTLWGQDGNDELNGGAGNDSMIGGLGIDTFVFSAGNDIIYDFNTIDMINLESVASITGFNDLRNNHATDVGGNLVIDDGSGNSFTLIGVSEASLQANDFLF
ncbi:calcium-binding protein [Sedimentitalea todarodis]|uniref:Calcium-binding protein n=1 Tax=Sedimentitalea todarodis TaxID=1631240 RepID=A0ABU3VCY9_9RHOB|nr:calcium-binding protein [Sedimentitalea todarodis]MDU9004043.1 calcium-binding protein [Sedimentitalea todarodis]